MINIPIPNNQAARARDARIGHWALVIDWSLGHGHWVFRRRWVRYLAPLVALWGLLVGCADTRKPTSRPASIQERQQQALHDPYDYGPDENMPTVSGGGTKDLDKKALKRDWDNFWR